MLAAYDLGMTKGDWMFLDVEIVQVSAEAGRWLGGREGEGGGGVAL